jgi:hypothetical protein
MKVQGVDGKHYLVDYPLIAQIAYSQATAQAKNQYSQIEETPCDSRNLIQVFTGQHPVMLSVKYNRKDAETFRDSHARTQLKWIYNSWSTPKLDPLTEVHKTLRGLLASRARHSNELQAKFSAVSDKNLSQLRSFDRHIEIVTGVRDGAYMAVAAIAVAPAALSGAVALTAAEIASVLGATFTLKAGSKGLDAYNMGKITDSQSAVKVATNIGLEAVFDGFLLIPGSRIAAFGAKTSVGKKMLVQALVRAPIEGAKSAANGDSLSQMFMSAGAGAASTLMMPLADCLAPFLTKAMQSQAAIDGTTSAIGLLADSIFGQGKNEASAHLGTQTCEKISRSDSQGMFGWIIKYAGLDSETKMINQCFRRA